MVRNLNVGAYTIKQTSTPIAINPPATIPHMPPARLLYFIISSLFAGTVAPQALFTDSVPSGQPVCQVNLMVCCYVVLFLRKLTLTMQNLQTNDVLVKFMLLAFILLSHKRARKRAPRQRYEPPAYAVANRRHILMIYSARQPQKKQKSLLTIVAFPAQRGSRRKPKKHALSFSPRPRGN